MIEITPETAVLFELGALTISVGIIWVLVLLEKI